MDTYEIEDNGRLYRVRAGSAREAADVFKKQKLAAVGDDGILDTIMNPLKAYANDATDWMMLSKQDEILAGMETPVDMLLKGLPISDAYSGALNRNELRRELMQAESPKAALAGKITGAVTGPATKAGADFVNKGATWIDRSIRAALPGGITGSIAGAEGDTLGDRAEGAAWGAGLGAALAPVAQAGGEFIGTQLSKAYNWIRGQGKQLLPSVAAGAIDDPVTASVMQQPGSQQVSRADMESAARELWRRLEADGRDPQKVFAAIQAGKMDERTLASIGGENVKQMIDTAASLPGRAKEIVAGAQRSAQQGQSQEIMKAAGQNLGVKQSYTDLEDLLKAQKGDAKPLYDAFYAVSPDRFDTPFMQNLLKNPLSKELLGTAQLINRIEKAAGETPDDVFQYLLDAEGNLTTNTTLSPQAVDYMKRAIDQKVRENMDPLTGEIKGAVGSAWEKLRRAFIANMDEVAPEYAAARQAFAGPASMKDAMQIGRSILKDDWIGNRKIIEEMSKSEKEALKIGAFQAIDDMLSGISNKADKAARLANIDKYLERLWPAFDSQKAFDAFKRAITSQTAEFQAVQMAGKGSQTLPRLADASTDLESLMGTGVDMSRAGGGDLTTIMRGIKALMGRMGAAGEGERAAQAALALTPGKQALPYLSAINQKTDPRALGLLLMSGSALPASQARGLLAPR